MREATRAPPGPVRENKGRSITVDAWGDPGAAGAGAGDAGDELLKVQHAVAVRVQPRKVRLQHLIGLCVCV